MTQFEIPILTSNGTMGGDSFAVSASSYLNDASQAFYAFDSSGSSTYWHSASGFPSWIQFYNPEPLSVEKLTITNRNVDGSMINTYGISYSDDGALFTEFITGVSPNQTLGGSFDVDVRGNGRHKYWRITSYSASGGNNSYTAIGDIKIFVKGSGKKSYWCGWKQPKMNSNNDYGTVTASSFAPNCDPYLAVDDITSTDSNGWATNSIASGWWMWKLPQKLRIHKIIFVNRNSSNEDPDIVSQQCQFYSDQGSTKMGPAFSTSKSREYVIVDCGGEQTDTIYFYKIGGLNSGIGELILDADEYVERGTLLNLEHLEGIYSYNNSVQMLYSAGKLVWKTPNYIPYTELVQPIFQDNFTCGFLNVSSNSSDAYKVFDGTLSSESSWTSAASAPQWLLWTLPENIIVSSITFRNNFSENGERSKTVQFFADEAMTMPLGDEFTVANEDGASVEIEVSPKILTSRIYCQIKDSYGSNGLVGVSEILVSGKVKTLTSFDYSNLSKYEMPILSSNASDEISLTCNNPEPTITGGLESVAWIQPVLDSNGTMGGDSFACDQSTYYNSNTKAYRCFNGDYTSSGESNRWQINSVNTSNEYYIYWYNSNPLKISNITVYNAESDYVVRDYVLYGSNDSSEWIPIVSGTNTNSSELSPWDVIVNSTDTYKYWRLGCYPANSASLQICEIQITAEEIINTQAIEYAPIYKLFDKDSSVSGWTTEVSDENPYITISFDKSKRINGLTIENGSSAIAKFDWAGSVDGAVYESLGTVVTPEFSHVANSSCNVAVPFSEDKIYSSYKFTVLESTGSIVDLRELALSAYDLNFVPMDFSYPFNNVPWYVTVNNSSGWYAEESSSAFVNNDIGDNGSTTLTMTVILTKDSVLEYGLAVSSESNYDWATFSVDDNQVWRQSGSQTVESSYQLSAGTHTLTFTYSKDGSSSFGSDQMKINYLRINQVS